MNTVIASPRRPAEIHVKYLGQCGFLFSTPAETIVIDPYLSDSVDRLLGFSQDYWKRAYPPPVLPSQLVATDLVLCTHAHLDHADPETLAGIAQASPRCLFGGTYEAINVFLQAGISPDRTFPLDDGVSHQFRDIEIIPIAVPHECYEVDAAGHQKFLSYLIKWSNNVIFHGGDMLVTPELVNRLAEEDADLALLPINGRDEFRRSIGVVGNMTVPEAIQFAQDCNFQLVIPTHYDLYSNNGESLERFSSTWAGHAISQTARWMAPQPGEEFALNPSSPAAAHSDSQFSSNHGI